MVSVTLSVSDGFKSQLKQFAWVNWSEIARDEALKKLIFENYIKKGALSDEEWKFCEMVDWHPVDELPLKDKFKKEMEKRKRGKFLKIRSVAEIFE